MLTLHVELLTGRYTATSHNDRRVAEWPPHPARLFAALVAASHDEENPDEQELEALDWLASLPHPVIEVFGSDEASTLGRRGVMTHYVPINDSYVCGIFDEKEMQVRTMEKSPSKASQKARVQLNARIADAAQPGKINDSALKASRSVLPEGRIRQARSFPSVTPEKPDFKFSWDVAETMHLLKLSSLALRVARLGHSSSLVSCRFSEEEIVPNLIPDPKGDIVLRTPCSGLRQMMEQAWEGHQESRMRFLPATSVRYGKPKEPTAARPESTLADEWVTFRFQDSKPPVNAGVSIANAIRGALMSHGPQPPNFMVSGHTPEGPPVRADHLSIVPLPFVGHRHADGLLRGFALLLPRNATEAQREAVYASIGAWERATGNKEGPPEALLQMGRHGVLRAFRERAPTLRTLQPWTWSQRSRVWHTVTPIVLDRYPGNLKSISQAARMKAEQEAAETISRAVERIGLPRPISVVLRNDIPISGGCSVGSFAPYQRKGFQKVLTHASLIFGEEVGGPIILGCGRYRGLGLCLPEPKSEIS